MDHHNKLGSTKNVHDEGSSASYVKVILHILKDNNNKKYKVRKKKCVRIQLKLEAKQNHKIADVEICL